MTDAAERRLARAIYAAIATRLDAGVGFLRVPELVTAMPVRDLTDHLRRRDHVRLALFAADADVGDLGVAVTREVHVAIDWRNDPTVGDDLVVIGDLERERATGLSELPTVPADEVRRRVFEQVIDDLRPAAPPDLLMKLLRALAGFR